MIERPSPNHDDRRGQAITMLVLHYTGMPTMAEALARLTDPDAKVSSHYLVDEDGTVFLLVPEERRAWHAGLSHWRGVTDVNAASVGIEIVNPGHEFGYRPYPPAQMHAVATLSRDILARHPAIPARNVVGHSDIAPLRKQDPGELFDWAWLAHQGIGVLPPDPVVPDLPALGAGDAGDPVIALQQSLKDWGCGLTVTGVYDRETTSVVTAFQRHFRPACVDGIADAQTRAILHALLRYDISSVQPSPPVHGRGGATHRGGQKSQAPTPAYRPPLPRGGRGK